MLKVAKVNFGGEIGTRPAVILNRNGEKAEVLKITTKAKGNQSYFKYRLSQFSGVRGYVCNSAVYTIPCNRIEKYTATLFEFEEKEIKNRVHTLSRQNKLKKFEIN